jgi:hypothetical protein
MYVGIAVADVKPTLEAAHPKASTTITLVLATCGPLKT